MMVSLCSLLLLAFAVSRLTCLAMAQRDSYLFHICSVNNDTRNSSFQKNLNTLLHSLSSGSGMNFGFHNLSEGQGVDKASIISLCRGDISESDCQKCVEFSSVDLLQRCPSQKEAVIWYDDCMFRYANRTILQSLEDPGIYMWSVKDVSNVGRFSQALKNLLPDLQQQASAGDSYKKFAVGETKYTDRINIYALVQCTPDLTREQCSSCLTLAFSFIDPHPERQGARVLGTSCVFRFDVHPFYKIISSPVHPATGGVSNNVRNIIIFVVSTICFVVLAGCTYILVRLRKRNQRLETVDGIVSADSLLFDFETIRSATRNFSDDNKLGQGGFGSVYKGKLADGLEIAVKRLAAGSGQGDTEFKNEVVLLAELQHRNIVRLLGFCLEGLERLLIFEFIPNASLDQLLFDPVKCANLDWERRYKIIGGIARGILYLHEDSKVRIIHRDLKASNILLDEEMLPKIADFGMARLCSVDQTQGNTTRIVGTYGYMAPEYAMHGHFSTKTDVYSFGVILLELLSGQKNSSFQVGNTAEDLASYAWESWRSQSIQKFIDPVIVNGHRNEIMRCIHIGLLCVQENVTARPSMTSVLLTLSSFSVSLPLPTKPAFFIHSCVTAEKPFISSGTSNSKHISDNHSINDISFTELHPR